MDNQNHNNGEYTLAEAANLVDRSTETLRLWCNDKKAPIDHKKFGTTYVITALGLEQAKEKVATNKPGPKGPRKKSGRRKTA